MRGSFTSFPQQAWMLVSEGFVTPKKVVLGIRRDCWRQEAMAKMCTHTSTFH